MPSGTSERGLERRVCTILAGHACDPPASKTVGDPPVGYGGGGWSAGNPHDYLAEYCVDLVQLAQFLHDTQPEVAARLALYEDGPTRRKFLARLQGEISKRGTIDLLCHGIKHDARDLELFYGTPSPANPQAQMRFALNRFTVTRQMRYSRQEIQRALDLVLFSNGGAQTVEQRELLCLHRHLQSQGARDLWQPHHAERRQHQLPTLPHLQHETGHPGGLHPQCARPLHPRRQLLQTHQNGAQVYSAAQVEAFVRRYLSGSERDQLDPILIEKRAMQQLMLTDEDGIIEPIPSSGSSGRSEPELNPISSIIRAFNELYGNTTWHDSDRVRQLLAQTIPARVAQDPAYQNAQRNFDKENARIEHDKALQRIMVSIMQDDTQLFKLFMDDEGFKRWLTDAIFAMTYGEGAAAA